MDDYTSNILNDSKNEWSILLINYITPHIIDGFKSIFNESIKLCEQNDEIEKYLMTFQNLLSRIPKWNQIVVLEEQTRIVNSCNCSYLEDLITCVHIIQLKILSCVRVGSETKKITIDVPDMASFIHQIYINIARKLYSNIYLFEIDIPPLEQQRRNREFELMVQTCIMNTIRDKIPVETLLRQFIDETQEVEVTRVEKTLNTVAKPLTEPVENFQGSNQANQVNQVNQNLNQVNQVNQVNQMNQVNQGFNQVNQGLNQNLNQGFNQVNQSLNILEPNDFNSINQTNSIQNFDAPKLNFDEPRRASISFNPEPSILEIEPREIESDKLDGISFDDLDSTPGNSVSLEFEEL